MVTAGADHLADGGVLQVLGNWAHVRGQDWTDRIAGWLQRTGCDAHVVQREVLDPASYVEVWLSDAGLAGSTEYADRYRAWLDYFDQLQIEAVGLGWLVLHRAGRDQPDVRIEDWPHPLEQPIGPALAAELRRRGPRAAADRPAAARPPLGAGRGRGRGDQWTSGVGRPEHVIFRQQRGFRRAVALDTATAGILGACDGELTLGQIVDSVAQLLSVEPAALATQTITRIRPLIVDGLIQ